MASSQPVETSRSGKLFLRIVLLIAAPCAMFLAATRLDLPHPVWWVLAVAVAILIVQECRELEGVRANTGVRRMSHPLTVGAIFVAFLATGCASTHTATSGGTGVRNRIDHQQFRRLDEFVRTAHSALQAVPLVPADASAALRAVTAEMKVVASFEKTEDEKWYGNTVFTAVAMASGEVYALQHPNERSPASSNLRVIDCFFRAPEGCYSDLRPCAPIEADTLCVKKTKP